MTSPAELQAIREHVAVFAKHIASPYHDTPESEYVAVELLSLLDAQSDEVRRLKDWIREHGHPDNCMSNRREVGEDGLGYYPSACDCGFDELVGSQP